MPELAAVAIGMPDDVWQVVTGPADGRAAAVGRVAVRVVAVALTTRGGDGVSAARVICVARCGRRTDVGFPADIPDDVVTQVEGDKAIPSRVIQPIKRVIAEFLGQTEIHVLTPDQVVVCIPGVAEILNRGATNTGLPILHRVAERIKSGDDPCRGAESLVDYIAGRVLRVEAPEGIGGCIGVPDADKLAGIVFVTELEATARARAGIGQGIQQALAVVRIVVSVAGI